MYERVGRYYGPLETVIRDVTWNPPGWGSAVIDQDVFPARVSQLIAIKPGGVIPLHRDDVAREQAIEGLLQRLHVVVQTNRSCWCFHDGTWQQLEEGGIYRMDPSKEHAAVNWGDTTRYHLVLDAHPA